VLVSGSGAARTPWRGGAPTGQQGGGSPMGSVDGEAEGYNGAAECTDGEGPAMAGDNPMVLLQLHASEGV
jgi:hypothetical protein